MTPEERARKEKQLRLLDLEIQIQEAEGREQPKQSAPKGASLQDLDRGQSGKRFLRGMLDPVVGTGQLLFEGLKDFTDLDEKLGISSEGIRGDLKKMDESVARGQRAHGRGDFDAMRLGGNVVTGAAMTAPLAGAGLGGATLAGGLTGASMPTASDEFAMSKGSQIAGGLLGGSGGYGLAKLGGWVGGKAAPLFANAKNATGRAVRSAIGEEKVDDVLMYLRQLDDPLAPGSAGEVAAPAGSTRFSALQKAVDSDILPDQAAAREAAQNAARMGVVDDLAGGYDDAVARRADITDPLREKSLGDAATNTAKQLQLTDDLAAQEGRVVNSVRGRYGVEGDVNQAAAKANNYSPVPGMPRAPGRYAPHQDSVLQGADEFIDDARVVEALTKSTRDMLKYQLDSMEALGIKAAHGNPIIRGIAEILESPSVKGNPTLNKLVTKISREIKGMADDRGVIHPESLYEFRKTGLDTTINRFMSSADDSVKRKMAGELSQIKPLLDKVIERAAGGGWKNYLKEYASLSKPVDQAKVGRVFQRALGDSLDENKIKPRVFTNALDDARGTLKKAKVMGESFEDVMTPGQMDKLGRLRSDLTRSAEFERLAGKGSSVGREAMGRNDVQLANPLMREIMVTNAALRRLSEHQQQKVMTELGRIFQRDPDAGFKLLIEAVEGSAPANSFITKLAQEVVTGAARPLPGVASGAAFGG